MPFWLGICPSLLLFCSKAVLLAAEDVAPAAPVVRVANTAPGMRVHPGFRVEIVANDSAVSAPAALAFDENGKLYVAEMRDYPERRDQSPHLGRIRMLEDTDGDGIFESSTVFAEDIAMPSAVACYNGGIFVAATPEILYLKDSNGDGVADERRIVFSGFGSDSSTFRLDFALNNFVWGLDNRIHGGASGIGGAISGDGTGPEPISLGQNDFSFDPRALTLSTEAGSAQSGLAFDNQGRKYFCDFTHPLRQALLEPEYFSRNPFFVAAQDSADVVSPMAQIFGLNAPNPSSNSRATGRPSPTGTIQSPALFTRARGCVIYRGNAFSSNFVGNAFIADPNAHCIHRVVLRENGLAVAANRAPDEQDTEFLSSSDPSFHPFQIVNGPDGTLYVADFRDGGDSGRILRIVPDNFKQPKLPKLGEVKTYDLVANLANANGWHRDTAARLLCEKRDPSALGLLTNMVNNARNPLARLHALATLETVGGFTEPVALKALRDSDPAIRERAVLLSEKLATDSLISEPLWNQLRFMADDAIPAVRYQVALTLGQIRHTGRPQTLAGMLLRASADIWMQNAIFSSLREGSAECFVTLANDGGIRNNPTGLDLLRRLASMIGTQGSMDEVSQVVDWLDRNSSDPRPRQGNIYVLAAGLGEGLRRTGSSLALVDPRHRLERVYGQAVSTSVDFNIADPLRLDAIRLLGVNNYSVTDTGDWFLLLVDGNQSQAVQFAALTTLAGYSDPRVVTSLVARWSYFSPALRKVATTSFLSRVERLNPVLSEIESGRIKPDDVSPIEANVLRAYFDQSIRQRATRIFGPLILQRPIVVENFRPALRLIGDANRGRELYQARCAKCHREDSARSLGPDLADMRALGKEKLLSSLVQPSAELQTKYLTFVIETLNGRLFTGLLYRQNPKTVTLITPANDEIVLPRVNIKSIRPQTWSLMPDGLEQGLTAQGMSDLLQYTLAPVR